MGDSNSKNIRLGLFLLVWLCLTLFLAYVLVFPKVLCDIGFEPELLSDIGFEFEQQSGLCRYAVLDAFGLVMWNLPVLIPLILFILASLFLIPFVTMYWIYLIGKPWISKKSNV